MNWRVKKKTKVEKKKSEFSRFFFLEKTLFYVNLLYDLGLFPVITNIYIN